MAVEILKVVHTNVNCSDLRRSLRFYTDFVGLRALSHTRPATPQDGSGFGLSGKALWDAYMLHDPRGALATCIDLLQWEIPLPTGRPYASVNHLGMARICLTVPDLDDLYARLASAGSPCRTPPQLRRVTQDLEARVFCCPDPDGTLLEFVENRGRGRVQLTHVNLNCSKIERSCEWYQRVLGLELLGESRPGPSSGDLFGLPGSVEWEARTLAPRRNPGEFLIDLVEWKQPRPVGRPYASANHLGIFRLAFLVESCDSAYQELRRQGVECPPPVWLEMGPEIPIDGLWAIFFRDPDGSCLELIESPRVHA